jgi:hypothetical protein
LRAISRSQNRDNASRMVSSRRPASSIKLSSGSRICRQLERKRSLIPTLRRAAAMG